MRYSAVTAETLSSEYPSDELPHGDLWRELAATLLEHAPVGIAVVEEDTLRIRLANAHLYGLLDEPYRSEGIMGLRLDEIIPDCKESGLASLIREVRRSGRAAGRKALWLEGLAGGPAYWEVTAASVAGSGPDERAMMIQVAGATVAGNADVETGDETSRREAFEQLKDDFLAVTAHELRTPVTALLGYTNLMVRRAEESDWTDRERHALRMIQAQAQRLTQLINGLVDVSRIQTGEFELRCQQVDVDALARQVAAELRTTIGDHTIEVGTPEAPVVVWGDAQRLEQVLRHLVDNALKYSPWGGAVQVTVWADTEAHVAVQDGGIGIPEEALPHLFQRFYRAANVDSERISGLGIGLYLVKEFVIAHGGRIDVQSTTEGTTVELVLPLYQVVSGQ